MTRAVWDVLLDRTRSAWTESAELSAYCPFPSDLTEQEVLALILPPAASFPADTALGGARYMALRMAAQAVASVAHWRDTYAGTAIPQDFRDRFGCYCLIGDGGPFFSETARAWFVYMPAHLYYPWHHHKADEAYLVLDGSAVFRRRGKPDETLSEGAILFHFSHEHHAMETTDQPVLALVVWRADFGERPLLSYADAR